MTNLTPDLTLLSALLAIWQRLQPNSFSPNGQNESKHSDLVRIPSLNNETIEHQEWMKF